MSGSNAARFYRGEGHRGNRALGGLFAKAREGLGLSVEEVARRANVSPEIVRRIEAGALEPYVVRSIDKQGRTVRVELDLEPAYEDELVILATTEDTPVRAFVAP